MNGCTITVSPTSTLLTAGPDLVHPAGVLVAGRVGESDLGLLRPLALLDMQVGAAQPGRPDLHHHVERPESRRLVDLVERESLVVRVQARGLHAATPFVLCSERAADRGRCRRWTRRRDRGKPATRPKRTRSLTGAPSPRHERRGIVIGRDAERPSQLAAARRVRSRQLPQRARRRAETPARPSRATSALRRNSSRRASNPPPSRPGTRGEAVAAAHRGVDLGPRVVVLEHDRHVAHRGQPAHGRAGVGRHQEGEVRRALRRRQAQAHLDVALRSHLAGADEAERRDRLVELRVVNGAELLEHTALRAGSRGPLRPAAATCALAGSPSGTGRRSSSGTSTSYSLAALSPGSSCRPRPGADSPPILALSGISQSRKPSICHFGSQIA